VAQSTRGLLGFFFSFPPTPPVAAAASICAGFGNTSSRVFEWEENTPSKFVDRCGHVERMGSLEGVVPLPVVTAPNGARRRSRPVFATPPRELERFVCRSSLPAVEKGHLELVVPFLHLRKVESQIKLSECSLYMT
jgi:hypothetical protein